jgi:hypothetical protein
MFVEVIGTAAAEGDKVRRDMGALSADHIRGTEDNEVVGSHRADGKLTDTTKAEAGASHKKIGDNAERVITLLETEPLAQG